MVMIIIIIQGSKTKHRLKEKSKKNVGAGRKNISCLAPHAFTIPNSSKDLVGRNV